MECVNIWTKESDSSITAWKVDDQDDKRGMVNRLEQVMGSETPVKVWTDHRKTNPLNDVPTLIAGSEIRMVVPVSDDMARAMMKVSDDHRRG